MSRYQVETIHGYLLHEVVSALQKAIRRGDEEAALYWAGEMDRSGYGKYCWKRLRIIVSEDIGLAEPNLPANVRALYETWADFKKEGIGGEAMFIVHAVMLMARAQKSRAVDHAINVYWTDHTPRREIPDEALDKHTGRGKAMGRGMDHFFDEAGLLNNRAPMDDPYEERARAILSKRVPVLNPQTPQAIERARREEEKKRNTAKPAGLFD